MHERIENISNAARAYADGYDDRHTPIRFQKYNEKFSELIVRECAQVCSKQRNPSNLNYKPSEEFAQAVKRHFGVYGVYGEATDSY